MGKTIIDISAEVLILIKMTYLNAFQLGPKPFKRVIAFRVSPLKKE